MALLPGHIEQFNTLLQAHDNGDLALVECTSATTGLPVAAICAMQREADGSTTIVPIARLFDGNPCNELLPPAP